MALLEYAITQPISLGRYNTLALILGATFTCIFVTLINVVAVGYELVPVTSSSFNDTSYVLWYERFLPTAWIPQSRTCEAAIIKLNECFFLYSKSKLIVDVTTNDFISYVLIGYTDESDGASVQGLMYKGSPLTNCTVQDMSFTQTSSDQVQTDVAHYSKFLIPVTSNMQYYCKSGPRSPAFYLKRCSCWSRFKLLGFV